MKIRKGLQVAIYLTRHDIPVQIMAKYIEINDSDLTDEQKMMLQKHEWKGTEYINKKAKEKPVPAPKVKVSKEIAEPWKYDQKKTVRQFKEVLQNVGVEMISFEDYKKQMFPRKRNKPQQKPVIIPVKVEKTNSGFDPEKFNAFIRKNPSVLEKKEPVKQNTLGYFGRPKADHTNKDFSKMYLD